MLIGAVLTVMDLFIAFCLFRSRLVEQPFAPLVQGYQNCRNRPSVVFFQEAGVAFGNVSIMTPFAIILVLSITYLYQCCTGIYIPKSYSASEKASALDSLAVALLLARDKRIIDAEASSSSKDSVAKRLSARSHYSAELHKASLSKVMLLDDIAKELEIIGKVAEKQYTTESSQLTTIDWQALIDSYFKITMVSTSSTFSGSSSDCKTSIEETGNEMTRLDASFSSEKSFQNSLIGAKNPLQQHRRPSLLVLNHGQYAGSYSDLSSSLNIVLPKNARPKLSTSIALTRAEEEFVLNCTNSLKSIIQSFEELIHSASSSSDAQSIKTSNINCWGVAAKTS